MYTLVPSKRFRRQVKKLAKANLKLLDRLEQLIKKLQSGKMLTLKEKDHALLGRLSEFRECHVAPNWLLVYRIHQDSDVLELLATGSHSDLFES